MLCCSSLTWVFSMWVDQATLLRMVVCTNLSALVKKRAKKHRNFHKQQQVAWLTHTLYATVKCDQT